MSVIEIDHLTKDYGHGRGVFDVSSKVEPGMCYGFLGPNGAGKSTTIRHLMGFSKPGGGTTTVDGLDSWRHSAEIQNRVGYLPGEIALPRRTTGTRFLRDMATMRAVRDTSYLDMLLQRFELDPDIPTKQMSLGVKRKLAVVTAFMHDPDILILDEPTSGLDPVMQDRFIEYVLEEKRRGRTIFLSSHIFHEVDAVCDRIAIIRDGKMASEFVPEDLKRHSDRIFRVTFASRDELDRFLGMGYATVQVNEHENQARVQLAAGQEGGFISDIASLDLADFGEIDFTLEDYFMHFYKEDKTFEGVG